MKKRYWHLLEDGTACTNDGCPQPNLYWAQDWSEPRANKNLNFFLRSAFSSMTYYIIKSRHNQKSKARRHVILFPPVYIFPCKLELISRRANKEEIALSLSPDQIRSSKMAVHFFGSYGRESLFLKQFVVVPNARSVHHRWMCIILIMWQGMKIPNLIYETIFWTQVQVDSSTNYCTFFWIRCNRNLIIPILCLEKVMVNSHPEKVAVIRVKIESK